MTHINRIDEMDASLLTIAKRDYEEAKRIINGMDFEEVKKLPQKDKRFSFGALRGDEGEGLIDLNFKSVCITVGQRAVVLTNYEIWDDDGQLVGVDVYKD